jgi:3-hydroxyisobutyrate dehydrogenase-like beta-hydroxyacid dehydrogenase
MKVGFIGLGNIGGPMAQNLTQPPFELTVYDVAPGAAVAFEGKATIAGSVADVAKNATRIGICVRDENDLSQVLCGPGGLFANCASGTVIAIHSTIRPATIKEVAEEAKQHGISIIDAPVSRGPAGLDASKFVCMAGAPPDVFEQGRPFLEAFSSKLIHAGHAVGDGMALKLCNNLITYIEFSAGIEAFRLAKAAGLSYELVREVLTFTGTLTNSMRQLADGMEAVSKGGQTRAMPFVSTANLADKDLSFALGLAEDVGVTLPVTTNTRKEFPGLLGV